MSYKKRLEEVANKANTEQQEHYAEADRSRDVLEIESNDLRYKRNFLLMPEYLERLNNVLVPIIQDAISVDDIVNAMIRGFDNLLNAREKERKAAKAIQDRRITKVAFVVMLLVNAIMVAISIGLLDFWAFFWYLLTATIMALSMQYW